MHDLPKPGLLADLRYTLKVLEESSHLGLNEEGAGKITRILVQQIAKLEGELAGQPTPVNPFDPEASTG